MLLGSRGERAAARRLKRRGFRIIARNYRCVAGEVDLVCSLGELFVFVEVKTRADFQTQNPWETVRPAQWRRIEGAARTFMLKYGGNRPYRFDLVTVVWPKRGGVELEHFEDVYEPVR
ncbi:MAG: YraN family protein [Planctomycetes bacterium]|nr:YraN family protein [Planctomycetota bacterium]